MNDAQEAALDKIKELIAEHFDCGVVCVEVEDDTGEACERQSIWHGGQTRVLGLMNIIQMRVLHLINAQYEQE